MEPDHLNSGDLIQAMGAGNPPRPTFIRLEKEPIIHVWVTKYALTDGIREIKDAVHCLSTCPSGSMISGHGTFENYHSEGKDWHRTRESAVKRAELMRVKKIASLKRKIKELEAMKF